jgi:hypothetical protein
MTAEPAGSRLILALPNGRILDEVMPLLRHIGILPEISFDDPGSRQLRFSTSEPDLDLIRVRSFDAATFVAFGSAQLGIAGNDVLMEFDYSEIYAPLDLEVSLPSRGRGNSGLGCARGCRPRQPPSGRHEVSGNHAPLFCSARDSGRVHQAQRRDRACPASWSLPSHRRSRPNGRNAEGKRASRDRTHRRGQFPADRQPRSAEDPPGADRRLDRALSRRSRAAQAGKA